MFRQIAALVFRLRAFNNKKIAQYALGIKNKRILEIGSGQHTHGRDHYSAKKYFNHSNEFVQSDINPTFGHRVIDITKFNDQGEFDVILCMNVLEHVYDFQRGIQNLHRALRDGGELIVFVPMIYPLHDEPYDFWRFTEHALRRMFNGFTIRELSYNGIRRFAYSYFLVLVKD